MTLCLVAGGAGFIGSRLVEALVARGDAVCVLDNFSTGTLDNLAKVRHQIEIIFGDLNDRELLREALDGVELLFQMAAPSYEAQETPSLSARWACPAENLQALTAASAAKVRRFIYASSCRVYGHAEGSCVTEGDCALPDSSYGFAKLAGELQCIGFTALYGLDTVRLRYAETFGPRQCPTSTYAQEVPLIVKSMLAGQAPVLADPGGAGCDLIHVDNVVHATLLAAETPRVSGHVYNIARGRLSPLWEVVATINQIRGTQLRSVCRRSEGAKHAPPALNVSRAEIDLGFCPSIDLRHGLSALIEHYANDAARSHADAGSEAPPGPHDRDIRSAPARMGAAENDS
jgi:UDP-N-acetylglucosamine/UDP-N-acetyl-alpha-D-glucosaminouronate 4-epimerase